MAVKYFEAVGRRKTASARVRLYPGTGTIMVNDRPLEEYFHARHGRYHHQSSASGHRHGERL